MYDLSKLPLTIYPSILKQERKAGRLLKTFKTSPDEGCDSAPGLFLSPGPCGTGYLESKKLALLRFCCDALPSQFDIFVVHLTAQELES